MPLVLEGIRITEITAIRQKRVRRSASRFSWFPERTFGVTQHSYPSVDDREEPFRVATGIWRG
jgi:hypothetical protein